MKRLTLTPDQVLATDDTATEDDPFFKIYYRVYARGGGKALPPIIVGTIKSPNKWIDRLEECYARWEHAEPRLVEMRRREYGILFQILRQIPYYILDGNHRALAAAVARQDLNVLTVDSEADLVKVDRMLATGELLSFPHKARSVAGLEGLFIQHCLDLNNTPPNHCLDASQLLRVDRFLPVATRAYELCTRNQLSAYMLMH